MITNAEARESRTTPAASAATLTLGVGLPGRVTITFTVAGGVLMGGFLVALMTITGRLSGHALLLTSAGLYLVGAVIGLFFGAVLGFFGRGPLTARAAVRKIALGLLYCVPAAMVSFIAAGWIAMTTIAVYVNKPGAYIGTGLGWLSGIVLVAVAISVAWKALRNALERMVTAARAFEAGPAVAALRTPAAWLGIGIGLAIGFMAGASILGGNR